MKQRGFTLIEGIVTIMIAGLLLAATLPNASAWIRNTRIRTAAESIQNGLQQARNEAVRRNTNVSFWMVSDSDPLALSNSCALSSTSAGWVVSLTSPVGACASAPSATSAPMIVNKQPSGEGSSGLSISATDSTATAATSVTFNGFGQVGGVASIACIKVENSSAADSRPLHVAISTAGQVRMCDPSPTLSANDPRVCPVGC